jgi:hypothetical protein
MVACSQDFALDFKLKVNEELSSERYMKELATGKDIMSKKRRRLGICTS